MATLLIVDDSAAWRHAIREAVERAGYTVCGMATDGLDALDAYKAHQPELVTLDIQMPRMSGLECLEALRLADPKARVVMVSGSSGAESRRRARELGAAGFVAKPFEPSDLIDAIAEAML